MDSLDSFAQQKLTKTFERFPASFSSSQSPLALIDDRQMHLFSSSNYLGFAEDPRLISAAQQASAAFGVGSGGSRLTTGTTTVHEQLEDSLKIFFGVEDAIFFATGYQANVSTISALAGSEVTIYSDQRNHASIIDGTRLAAADCHIFPHRDYDHLERLLAQRTTRYALVITDGVFSMNGTLADLPRLREICDNAGAWLMVDDAHGIGAVGATGRGTGEHFATFAEITIGTASKALGAEGGFTLCSAPVGRYLRNSARSFIFSTAPTPATCAAVSAALNALSPELVAKLHDNIEHMARELHRTKLLHCSDGGWSSPIFPIAVGSEDTAVRAAQALRAAGFFAPAIRYPTVPRGQAIVRATVMATHSPSEISSFVGELSRFFGGHSQTEY